MLKKLLIILSLSVFVLPSSTFGKANIFEGDKSPTSALYILNCGNLTAISILHGELWLTGSPKYLKSKKIKPYTIVASKNISRKTHIDICKGKVISVK